MNVIQSFAKYKEVTPYLDHKNNKEEYYYLNYYSMLLSYITQKKQYGSVTMYCNQEAYDSLIKYIPYDHVEIIENQNNIYMWSKYKLDIMRLIGDDFIHVDPDVFIFDDFYKSFIDGDCDVLIQDVVSRKKNDTKGFVFDNLEFLKNNQIFTKQYDGQGFSCGSVGLSKRVQEPYFNAVDILHNEMSSFGVDKIPFAAMILEETLLYLITTENDFKYDFIIPQKEVDKHGLLYAGDKIGYVHVWAKNKFKRQFIQQIRAELFKNNVEYLDYLIKFEREIMRSNKLFKYVVLPNDANIN